MRVKMGQVSTNRFQLRYSIRRVRKVNPRVLSSWCSFLQVLESATRLGEAVPVMEDGEAKARMFMPKICPIATCMSDAFGAVVVAALAMQPLVAEEVVSCTLTFNKTL